MNPIGLKIIGCLGGSYEGIMFYLRRPGWLFMLTGLYLVTILLGAFSWPGMALVPVFTTLLLFGQFYLLAKETLVITQYDSLWAFLKSHWVHMALIAMVSAWVGISTAPWVVDFSFTRPAEITQSVLRNTSLIGRMEPYSHIPAVLVIFIGLFITLSMVLRLNKLMPRFQMKKRNANMLYHHKDRNGGGGGVESVFILVLSVIAIKHAWPILPVMTLFIVSIIWHMQIRMYRRNLRLVNEHESITQGTH